MKIEKVENWGSFDVLRNTEKGQEFYTVVNRINGDVLHTCDEEGWAQDKAQILHWKVDVYGD